MTNGSSIASDERAHLEPGTPIAHYRIAALIGAGGMGEVYRARDTRLDRDVALKVIPTRFGRDQDRVRRFMQEVRTMCRLNHPNIVSIFDAGEHGGRPYIVSELLEGQTIRERLETESPLPVRRVVDYAIQIARGLAAAHEKGIVHRDLKPANIFIADDGYLKILDFGLAKLAHPEWDGGDGSDTITVATGVGVIVGTRGYMSPEQVEARPLDCRSDIFSFGTTLYEMLSGIRAFGAASTSGTIAAILTQQPRDLCEIQPQVPPALAAIVERCLAKRPEDRFQSARDLVFSLEELVYRSSSFSSSAFGRTVRQGVRRARTRPAISITTFAMTIGAVIVLTIMNTRSSAGPGTAGTPAAANVQLMRLPAPAGISAVALAPDGKYAAEVRDGNPPELWLTHVPTSSEVRLMTAADGNYLDGVHFSPDGNFIYFARTHDRTTDICRIAVLGGDSQTIVANASGTFTLSPVGEQVVFTRYEEQTNESAVVVAAIDGSGQRKIAARSDGSFLSCSWAPAANRLICPVALDGLAGIRMVQIDATSGSQLELPGMMGLVGPEWLPDGSALVGEAKAGLWNDAFQIWRVAYPSGKAERLTNDLSSYVGLTVASAGAALSAVRVDTTTNLWTMAVDHPGSPRQITSGVNTQDGNLGVRTTASGQIVWASGISGRSIDLWTADADGSNRKRLTFDDAAGEKWPDVSPDGRSIVYVRDTTGQASGEIWRANMDGTLPVRLTDGSRDRNPHFTAGGQSIVFSRPVGSGEYLFEVPASGGRPSQFDPRPVTGAVPSPDGKWILVNVDRPKPHIEVWSMSDHRAARVLPYTGLTKRWRPDSRAFAFIWPGHNGMNIWRQDLDTAAPEQITRLPDGEIAAYGFDWTRDGKAIVFARRSQMRDWVLLKNVR